MRTWISPTHHDPTKVAKKYKAAEPFPHIALKGFLREGKARQLEKALLRQRFQRKESDLFRFSQTNDLRDADDRVIEEFLAMVQGREFRSWLTKVTGVKVRSADAMGVIYGDADYLLCHDDQLEGRQIAYILYLSRGFTRRSGGALALLDSDSKGRPRKVVKRITPEWNTLGMFTVSRKSHHQVEEVLEDKRRLTIGGWFHG